MIQMGKKLAKLRKNRKITQSDIGDYTELTNREISHLETGRRNLRLGLVIKYIRFLQSKQQLTKKEWEELFGAIIKDLFGFINNSENSNFLKYSIDNSKEGSFLININAFGFIFNISTSIFTCKEWESFIDKQRDFIIRSIIKMPDKNITSLFNVLKTQ